MTEILVILPDGSEHYAYPMHLPRKGDEFEFIDHTGNTETRYHGTIEKIHHTFIRNANGLDFSATRVYFNQPN